MTKDAVSANVRKRALRTRRVGFVGLVLSVAVGVWLIYSLIQPSGIQGAFSADFNRDFLHADSPAAWVPLITTSLTRIGAVFIAIYCIQVLISFTKYSFRIADHFEAVADSMDFFAADERLLNTLLEALSPRHITFGKDPSTPVQEIIALAQTAMKTVKDSR